MKLSKLIITLFQTSLLTTVIGIAYAQPTSPSRVDNYNIGQNPQNQNNTMQNQPPTPAQPQANYNSNGLPPGTYNVQNGNGTTSTVYTTGDKQPYIVDPPSNGTDSPIIQPFVNYGPNGPLNGNEGMLPNNNPNNNLNRSNLNNNPGFRGNSNLRP